MCGEPGPWVDVDRFGSTTNLNVQAPRQDRGRANDRVVRSRKTENAMSTGGTLVAGGQSWRAWSSVQTEFEGRLAIVARVGEVQSAEDEQKALHGNRIGGHDGDECSPRPFPPGAEPDHVAADAPP